MEFSLVISRCTITRDVWISQGSVATLIRRSGGSSYCPCAVHFQN